MMAPSYLSRGFLWVSQILLLLLLFPSCVPSDSDDNSRLEIEESTGEVRALLDRTLTTEYLSLLERYPYEGFTLLMALSVNDLFPQLPTNESHWNLSVKWFRFCGLKGHVNPTVKHDLTSHYSTLNLNNIPFKVLDRPKKLQGLGDFHSDIDQRDYEVVVKIFRREMERFDLEYDHHLYDNYTMDDVDSFGMLDIDAKYARLVELMMTILPKWKDILVEWKFMEHVTLPKLLNPICEDRSHPHPSNNATIESYCQNPRIDSTSHLTDYFNCTLFSTLSLNTSKLVESPTNRAISIPEEFRSFMGEVVAPSTKIPIKSHKFLYRDAFTWLYKDYVMWFNGTRVTDPNRHKLIQQVVLYLTLLQPEKMNHIREQSAISTSTVLLIVLIIVLAVLVVIALFCIGAELVARYRKQQTMEIQFQLE